MIQKGVAKNFFGNNQKKVFFFLETPKRWCFVFFWGKKGGFATILPPRKGVRTFFMNVEVFSNQHM